MPCCVYHASFLLGAFLKTSAFLKRFYSVSKNGHVFQPDIVENGVLLDGFPRTKGQARHCLSLTFHWPKHREGQA